ncbi:MAG: M28 family peptidase [Candidatus Lokiarchaeota archaeon]|nr:M28 family peptidase [Candidatus Lokiarchaeota archaeon]
MSKDYKIDSEENSEYMYNIINKILTEIGPRGSCSKEEEECAELLVDELNQYCDKVEKESFETFPQLSVHAWIPRSAFFIILSTLIFISFYNLSSLIVSAIGTALLVFNVFLVYKHYLNAEMWGAKILFCKPKPSQNVIGIFKPKNEVKKRVIFGSHIDSALRFNIAHFFREAYIYFIFGAILSIFTFLILSVVQLIYSISGFFITGLSTVGAAIILNWIIICLIPGATIFILIIEIISASLGKEKREKILYGSISQVTRNNLILMGIIIAYLIIINILLFNTIFSNPNLWKTWTLLVFNSIHFLVGMLFFTTNKVVPGALDNLSALAINCAIAKILKNWKENHPDLYPKNTEVILANFGCEEVGSKGSFAYAEKHSDEFKKIDTSAIALDTIGDPELINIFTEEGSTRVKYDEDVYNLLAECAEDLGLNYKVGSQPLVSGGTDGSGLVKGGLTKTSAFVGLRYSDYLYYYHTDRDDITIINKEKRPCEENGTSWKDRNYRCAFENGLKLCLKYIEKKDKE